MTLLPLRRAQNGKYLEAQARIFKALGHPSRLLMVEALLDGPLCVADLQHLVGPICLRFPVTLRY